LGVFYGRSRVVLGVLACRNSGLPVVARLGAAHRLPSMVRGTLRRLISFSSPWI